MNQGFKLRFQLFFTILITLLIVSCAEDKKVEEKICSDSNCSENSHCEKDINEVLSCKCNEDFTKVGEDCVKNGDNTSSKNLFVTGETSGLVEYDDGSTQRGIQRSYKAENDIILDRRTEYYWQNNEDAQLRTWQEAEDYCNTLNLENKKWRLPNLKELLTIVDFKHFPAVSPIFTKINIAAGTEYWTSRKYLETNAYYIDLDYGVVEFKEISSTNKANAICVSIAEDNTYGKSNNLVWESLESSLNNKLNWYDAIDYCENLDLDGYTDWHLPNINELYSTIDETIELDPNDRTAFWSSTFILYNSQFPFTLRSMEVVNKTTIVYEAEVEFNTRCVRSDNFASYNSGEWGDIILNSRYKIPKDALLIDIRTEGEKEDGHPKNAITTVVYSSDYEKFLNDIKKLIGDNKELHIILTCASSGRSSNAVKILSSDGFSHVEHIVGGTNKWEEFNLGWESAK